MFIFQGKGGKEGVQGELGPQVTELLFDDKLNM